MNLKMGCIIWNVEKAMQDRVFCVYVGVLVFSVAGRYYVTVIHVLIWTCEVHICLEDSRVTL